MTRQAAEGGVAVGLAATGHFPPNGARPGARRRLPSRRRLVSQLSDELFVLCCHRHVSWTELCIERVRRAPRFIAMHIVCEKDKTEGMKNVSLWAPLHLSKSDCNYRGR